ncbi:MAG: hypothetical protein GWN16_15270, partial [Calditrichae bacterium]|nr:hypothetical protein [Calditrichia bacterium]
FVILNHQSALDPFITGAFWDRHIAFLTKSTSFIHWLPRLLLRWAMALPTTRYQTDPQIITIMDTLFKRNTRIGIFPEGERCWDGKLQAFKLSVVKILMSSREAIYPLVIQNTFKFWPRWATFPRRAKIKITIAPPFCLVDNYFSIDEQRQFLEDYFRDILQETDQ